ncbi:hypothetical protein [Vitiosangium sp. GDMCC 1.1324]|uniref:hypothetical protein n=1 Tax=Vitiosangium sp. (strain GDMCC 1.1324) TaxID=2138576 RepID=UPI000D347828|nr:hypothetical protein [Vitiosangium sp. GDMCC 1.1324]PTL76634.1 hypothetical protein DAT35_47700 [Vitiosangium sp. GDMCC 1.1324]
MGVTFFWLSLSIPLEHASNVAAHFAEAVTASPVSQSARRVLDRWREAPSSLSPESVPDPARPGFWMKSEGTVDFEELFRPEALSAFGQGFIRTGAEANDWGIEPTAENASLVITDRIPAAAALYFGLGAERAARMPGHFGALFAAPADVGQLLPVLDAVLERPSPEMLARARRWLARGNNQDLRPEELFAFIPRALRTAHTRGEGLLLLTARG